MPKLSSPQRVTIPSLVQGVSQQPEHRQIPGSLREQINGWSSPVEGLRKRHPAFFRHRLFPLTDTIRDNGFFVDKFIVQFRETYSVVVAPHAGKYFLGIYKDGIRVPVAAHGTGISVGTENGPDGISDNWIIGDSTSYLARDATPLTTFQSQSINELNRFVLINNGPFGLLLNRERIVKMDSAMSPELPKQAMLFVQGVNYDITYKLTVDGSEYTFTTPKATDDPNEISNSLVVTGLTSQLPTDTYDIVEDGSVAFISRKDGGEIAIKIDDGYSNTFARIIYKEIPTTGYLPTRALDGFKVKISSDPAQTADDRWIVFRHSVPGGGIQEGIWEETVAPSTPIRIDSQTMPFVLYRAADSRFFFGPADGTTQTLDTETYTFPAWGERTVGDVTSAKDPPFVGQKIRDHLIFRSRYSLASGSSVIFSEVDDIFNFFPDTTLDVLESDSFSINAYSETSTELNWLLPVDETMIAVSSDTQFSVRPADADVLTPRSAVILRLSNIEMNPRLRPKIAGPNMLFATDEFGFTNFREYQFFDSTQRRLGLNLGGSLNVSKTTPKYIRGPAYHWDVGETLDYMACITPDAPEILYIYKYYNEVTGNGIQKAQMAWSKWEFSSRVANLFFNENSLTLFMADDLNGVYVTEINTDELQDTEIPDIHLDKKILYPECNNDTNTTNDVVATYDPITNTTTFALPYSFGPECLAVVRFTDAVAAGTVLGSAENDNKIICEEKGDHRSLQIAFGERYTFRAVLGHFYFPGQDALTREITGQLAGRTQIHTAEFHHFTTGRYKVIVDRINRRPTTNIFRARSLGVQNNRLSVSERPLGLGSLRVPVYSKNTEHRISIESDNWLPLTIVAVDWEGSYDTRSRKV